MICRETRAIMMEVQELASKYGVSILAPPKDIMMWEYLCMRYYTKPMLSIIRQKLRVYKGRRTSKLFSPDYWLVIIPQVYTNNASVVRERINEIGLPCNLESFKMFVDYMPSDYSINDAYTIYHIALNHTPQAISKAIQTARGNNVYSIPYVKAIIDKEQAISNIKMNDARQRIEQASLSADILNREKVQNTPEDIEESKQHWERMVEDAEFLSKIEDMYG